MPYTTSEQVYSHLAAESLPARSVVDLPLLIDTNDPVRFSSVATHAEGLRIKARRARTHTRTTQTLTDPLTFSPQPVVPGSVVVASDSSMGQVFIDPADYLVNSAAGTLRIRPGGPLTAGAPVTIWYRPYTLLVESTDYHLDLDLSTIRRTPSGDIASGETIYLDFTPRHATVTDEMIQSAVHAANGLVERLVDPSGQFEADPVLGLAATYSALEIVCRSAAARDLSFQSGQDRTARTWMQLATDYAARAEGLIAAFRPPVTPLSAPTIS